MVEYTIAHYAKNHEILGNCQLPTNLFVDSTLSTLFGDLAMQHQQRRHSSTRSRNLPMVHLQNIYDNNQTLKPDEPDMYTIRHPLTLEGCGAIEEKYEEIGFRNTISNSIHDSKCTTTKSTGEILHISGVNNGTDGAAKFRIPPELNYDSTATKLEQEQYMEQRRRSSKSLHRIRNQVRNNGMIDL